MKEKLERYVTRKNLYEAAETLWIIIYFLTHFMHLLRMYRSSLEGVN